MALHPLVFSIDVDHAHRCCYAVIRIGSAVSTVRGRWNTLMIRVIASGWTRSQAAADCKETFHPNRSYFVGVHNLLQR